ncbi:MAG: lysophospholipid acyltransferase family protein [Acidobacteria bacterium]|nr:lysophospholipid acyltransferase family protein [Acidobacteriota bacterium]
MTIARLPDAVPHQGNVLTRAIGRLGLALCRFRIAGAIPDIGRCVMIVAPHTSNWDFVVGMSAKLALGLRVQFIGKHTLFRWPLLAGLMRWLGGIPVDRAAAGGIVDEAVAWLQRHDRLFVVIAPEGTRKRVESWKSGFYRIAVGAGVPILPVALDYADRAVTIGPVFAPSGDYDQDLPRLHAYFRREMALRPEGY